MDTIAGLERALGLGDPTGDKARTVYLGSGRWPPPQSVRMPSGKFVWPDRLGGNMAWVREDIARFAREQRALEEKRLEEALLPGMEAHFKHRERSGHTVAVSLSGLLERLESVESELARTRERVDELETGRAAAAPETVPVDQEGGIMFGQMSRDFNRRVNEKLARVRAEHKAEDDKEALREKKARTEKVNVIVNRVALGLASVSLLSLVWVVAQRLLGG